MKDVGIDEEKIIPYYEFSKVSPHNIGTFIADWDKGISSNEFYDELCKHDEELSLLEREFLFGKHNRSFKWLHYFEIYNLHLQHYYGKNINIMEVGVNEGGSLQLWKKMFGSKAKIIGVDINQKCKRMEDDQISIYIGDQVDRDFWKQVKSEVPKLDILIDDGGHAMRQQIVTFEEMYPHINPGGGYIFVKILALLMNHNILIHRDIKIQVLSLNIQRILLIISMLGFLKKMRYK